MIVLLVEAHRGLAEGVERIVRDLSTSSKDRLVVLAINKIDKVKSPVLLSLTKQMNELFSFSKTFLISADPKQIKLLLIANYVFDAAFIKSKIS